MTTRISIRVWHFDGTFHAPWLRYAGMYPEDAVYLSNERTFAENDRQILRWGPATRQHHCGACH